MIFFEALDGWLWSVIARYETQEKTDVKFPCTWVIATDSSYLKLGIHSWFLLFTFQCLQCHNQLMRGSQLPPGWKCRVVFINSFFLLVRTMNLTKGFFDEWKMREESTWCRKKYNATLVNVFACRFHLHYSSVKFPLAFNCKFKLHDENSTTVGKTTSDVWCFFLSSFHFPSRQ